MIEDWSNEKGSVIDGYERVVSLLYSIRAKDSCEGFVRKNLCERICANEFVVEQVILVPVFDQTTRVRGVAHLKLCRLQERLVCRAARIR